MATVDELIVQIRADTRQLQKGLATVQGSMAALDKRTNTSILSFKRLGGVLAAVGIGAIGANVVSTAAKFETLEASLRAITGSAEAAGASFDVIRAFTAGTTFQLENVSSAFTTLLNAGITPTTDVLQDFGNVAAAFGKDITQISQAAFNATTGEMEMLKQFGIIAKVEGDKLAVTFQNNTQLIERDGQSIIDFIRKIGSEKFPTALEETSKTVSGSFSNLKDALAETSKAIGDSGLNQVIVGVNRSLISLVKSLTPLASLAGGALATAFNVLGQAVAIARANLNSLSIAAGTFAALQLGSLALSTGKAFVNMARAVGGAGAAIAILNKVTKKNVIFAGLAVAAGLAAKSIEGAEEKIAGFVDEALKVTGISTIFEKLSLVTQENTKNQQELDEALKNMLEGMNAAGKGNDDLGEKVKTATEEIGDMTNSIAQQSQQFTTTFVTALMDGQNALDAFKNFAKNIVAQIISTFLQMAIVNKILNSIFGNVSGFTPLPEISLFGGGGDASGGSVNAGFSPQNFPFTGMPKRATGGRGSGPMLVGERGPELFIPNTGGRIMNNHSSRMAMGGDGIVINQNLNFSTGVVPTVRQEVMKMLPTISDVTKASVLEAASRGGTYRRGLLGG